MHSDHIARVQLLLQHVVHAMDTDPAMLGSECSAMPEIEDKRFLKSVCRTMATHQVLTRIIDGSKKQPKRTFPLSRLSNVNEGLRDAIGEHARPVMEPGSTSRPEPCCLVEARPVLADSSTSTFSLRRSASNAISFPLGMIICPWVMPTRTPSSQKK